MSNNVIDQFRDNEDDDKLDIPKFSVATATPAQQGAALSTGGYSQDALQPLGQQDDPVGLPPLPDALQGLLDPSQGTPDSVADSAEHSELHDGLGNPRSAEHSELHGVVAHPRSEPTDFLNALGGGQSPLESAQQISLPTPQSLATDGTQSATAIDGEQSKTISDVQRQEDLEQRQAQKDSGQQILGATDDGALYGNYYPTLFEGASANDLADSIGRSQATQQSIFEDGAKREATTSSILQDLKPMPQDRTDPKLFRPESTKNPWERFTNWVNSNGQENVKLKDYGVYGEGFMGGTLYILGVPFSAAWGAIKDANKVRNNLLGKIPGKAGEVVRGVLDFNPVTALDKWVNRDVPGHRPLTLFNDNGKDKDESSFVNALRAKRSDSFSTYQDEGMIGIRKRELGLKWYADPTWWGGFAADILTDPGDAVFAGIGRVTKKLIPPKTARTSMGAALKEATDAANIKKAADINAALDAQRVGIQPGEVPRKKGKPPIVPLRGANLDAAYARETNKVLESMKAAGLQPPSVTIVKTVSGRASAPETLVGVKPLRQSVSASAQNTSPRKVTKASPTPSEVAVQIAKPKPGQLIDPSALVTEKRSLDELSELARDVEGVNGEPLLQSETNFTSWKQLNDRVNALGDENHKRIFNAYGAKPDFEITPRPGRLSGARRLVGESVKKPNLFKELRQLQQDGIRLVKQGNMTDGMRVYDDATSYLGKPDINDFDSLEALNAEVLTKQLQTSDILLADSYVQAQTSYTRVSEEVDSLSIQLRASQEAKDKLVKEILETQPDLGRQYPDMAPAMEGKTVAELPKEAYAPVGVPSGTNTPVKMEPKPSSKAYTTRVSDDVAGIVQPKVKAKDKAKATEVKPEPTPETTPNAIDGGVDAAGRTARERFIAGKTLGEPHVKNSFDPTKVDVTSIGKEKVYNPDETFGFEAPNLTPTGRMAKYQPEGYSQTSISKNRQRAATPEEIRLAESKAQSKKSEMAPLPKADEAGEPSLLTPNPKKVVEIYQGTRVMTDDPDFYAKRSPVDGGTRAELGTAHYFSSDPEEAAIYALADSNRDLPNLIGRTFGDGNVKTVKIDESKLLDFNDVPVPWIRKLFEDVALIMARKDGNAGDAITLYKKYRGAIKKAPNYKALYSAYDDALASVYGIDVPADKAYRFHRQMSAELIDKGVPGYKGVTPSGSTHYAILDGKAVGAKVSDTARATTGLEGEIEIAGHRYNADSATALNNPDNISEQIKFKESAVSLQDSIIQDLTSKLDDVLEEQDRTLSELMTQHEDMLDAGKREKADKQARQLSSVDNQVDATMRHLDNTTDSPCTF